MDASFCVELLKKTNGDFAKTLATLSQYADDPLHLVLLALQTGLCIDASGSASGTEVVERPLIPTFSLMQAIRRYIKETLAGDMDHDTKIAFVKEVQEFMPTRVWPEELPKREEHLSYPYVSLYTLLKDSTFEEQKYLLSLNAGKFIV